MANISFILPLDQPLGHRRLLQELKNALSDARFNHFRLIVAYAKSGPLYRLHEYMEKWTAAGKTAEAIIGIDQQGTSKEALELALSFFNKVYVTRERGITFHPKIYLFSGDKHAVAFVGSNNLTVGGTEKNFEAAVRLQLDLPADAADLTSLETAWVDLLPESCPATIPLNRRVLRRLMADNVIVDEKSMHTNPGNDASVGWPPSGPQSGLTIIPESPIPKRVLTGKRKSKTNAMTARGLAIQIKPHHNGEIFLSLTAASQYPEFFHWPFTGTTTPKKAGNASYPQLVPDPVVNITVFGEAGNSVLSLSGFALNTVYYEKKSEIRITASPLVGIVPEYSVMIMELSSIDEIDYEISIHIPASPEYAQWVDACNQTMPGGGKTPRKFGWF